MSFLSPCHEHDELPGGKNHDVIALKPIAYDDAGTLKRNVLTYESKGVLARPLVLDRAPLVAQVANNGGARLCPVWSNPAAYVEFGAPLLKAADKFEPVSGLSSVSLSKAQTVKVEKQHLVVY